MLTMIENVFIFGVILPAVITILFFLGFLLCWFKCDFLREKILAKCAGRKAAVNRSSGSSPSNSNTHNGRRIHYIKEGVDGRRERNLSGGSDSVVIHMRENTANAQTANHPTGPNHAANMGFELGEDFTYLRRGDDKAELPTIHGSSISAGIVQNVADLMDRNRNYGGSGSSGRSDSSHGSQRPVLRSHMLNRDKISSPEHQIHTELYHAAPPLTASSPKSRQTTQDLTHESWGSPAVNMNKGSPSCSKDIELLGATGGEKRGKREATHKHAQYVQQVFQFPGSGRHHTSQLTHAPLDSSNYSSSSNEGQDGYLDYGDSSAGSSTHSDNYRHFIPASQYSHYNKSLPPGKVNHNQNGGQSSISREEKYDAGKVLSAYHISPHHHTSAMEISAHNHRTPSTSTEISGVHKHSAHRYNTNQSNNNTKNKSGKKMKSSTEFSGIGAEYSAFCLYKTLGSGTGSHRSSCASVDTDGVGFVFNKDGVSIIDNM